MRSRTPLGGEWAAKKSITGIAACCARRERPGSRPTAEEQRDELAPSHSITSSARASSVGLPPLALSGALLVRRDHGDANMHRVHDLAPHLSVKPIGELVQPLTGKLAAHGRNGGGTSHSCQSGHARRRSRAAPAAPEDALWMDAPDFAVAQPGLRIQSSI